MIWGLTTLQTAETISRNVYGSASDTVISRDVVMASFLQSPHSMISFSTTQSATTPVSRALFGPFVNFKQLQT